MSVQKASFELNENHSNDDVFLNLCIKQCNEDLKSVNRKIEIFLETHKCFQPKSKYDSLLQNYQSLTENLAKTKRKFLSLYTQYSVTEDEQRNLISLRDKMYKEACRMRRDKTPRPNWIKCADYMSIGKVKWLELVNKESSETLLTGLMNEFVGANDGTNVKHEFLPEELVVNTKMLHSRARNGILIKNMKLTKRDLHIISRDILSAKFKYDESRSLQSLPKEKLITFLFLYFRKKYKSNNLAIDWFYNIIDASNRLAHDERIGLFKGILEDKIDEEIFYGFIETTYELYKTSTFPRRNSTLFSKNIANMLI